MCFTQTQALLNHWNRTCNCLHVWSKCRQLTQRPPLCSVCAPLLHRAKPKGDADEDVICLDSPPSANGVATPAANGNGAASEEVASPVEAIRELYAFQIGTPEAADCPTCRRLLAANAQVKEVRAATGTRMNAIGSAGLAVAQRRHSVYTVRAVCNNAT